MHISEMLSELAAIQARFGNIEVRAGSAVITRVAVLPYAAIDTADNAQQPNMQQFVALLSRNEDKVNGPGLTWP